MQNPFLPRSDFISPSLNRVRIVDLPGLDLPAHIAGKLGYELLSASALRQMVTAQNHIFQLDLEKPHLLTRFNQCFASDSPPICRAAQDIAIEYGRRLAYLLLTLRRGDPINRAARAGWEAYHWRFWQSLHTYYVGGGLVSGPLGPLAIAAARQLLDSIGSSDLNISLSPDGSFLSMVGAARFAPTGTKVALLFDFGHTNVKRGVSVYADQAPQITHLPSVPAPCEQYEYRPWPVDKAQAVHAAMVSLMVDTWCEANKLGYTLDPLFLTSIAVYLFEGHPHSFEVGSGCYGRLQLLCNNLEQYLSETVGQRLGQSVVVRLVHDGVAAAAVYAGHPNTAVVTLGTALGVGFP